MKQILMILAVLFVGCANQPDVFVPDGWTVGQEAVLSSAARDWCEATKGQCCPTLGDGTSKLHGVDAVWTGAAGVHMKRSDGSEIWIDRHFEGDTLHYVALHEFGHYCGFNPDASDAHEWFCASGSISPEDLKAAGY